MKVLFVQLFARQFHPIQSAYDGPLELDYLDSAQDESIERLKAKAASADKVVLITKFISHKHSDVVPRDKVEYLDSVNIDRALAILKKIEKEAPDESYKKVDPNRPTVQVIKKPIKEYKAERAQEMSSSTTRKVGDYILTTAVPPPSKTKGRGSLQKTSEYPLADMKVGESFFKEAKDDDDAKKIAARVAAAWHWLRKANPNLHFQSAKYMSPHGVRVWRLADFTREELAEMKANKQKQKGKK